MGYRIGTELSNSVVDVPRMQNTEVFKTDVRQVFDFIRCSKDDESLRQSKMIISKEAGSICAKQLMI